MVTSSSQTIVSAMKTDEAWAWSANDPEGANLKAALKQLRDTCKELNGRTLSHPDPAPGVLLLLLLLIRGERGEGGGGKARGEGGEEEEWREEERGRG